MTKTLAKRLHSGERLVLSGPVGTQLGDHGIETPPPLYSANGLLTPGGRGAVGTILRGYVAAGADILATPTYGLRSTYALAEGGIDPGKAQMLTAQAVAIARQAAQTGGRRVHVVGTAGSIEDSYDPAGKLTATQLTNA